MTTAVCSGLEGEIWPPRDSRGTDIPALGCIYHKYGCRAGFSLPYEASSHARSAGGERDGGLEGGRPAGGQDGGGGLQRIGEGLGDVGVEDPAGRGPPHAVGVARAHVAADPG